MELQLARTLRRLRTTTSLAAQAGKRFCASDRITAFAALMLIACSPAALQAQNDYSSAYTFSTLAGSPPYGSDDGVGAAARFNSPAGIVIDGAGNYIVADSENDAIRKVTPAGVVTTIAGKSREPGTADGNGTAARFNQPTGMATDASGNIYIVDRGSRRLRKMTPAGDVTTIAGQTPWLFAGQSTNFTDPVFVSVDGLGNAYVLDSIPLSTTRIWKITPAGTITSFSTPGSTVTGMVMDASGGIFFSLQLNGGAIKYIAAGGGAPSDYTGSDTEQGWVDGVAGVARFRGPFALALATSGRLAVADQTCVRLVEPDGSVSTLAGAGDAAGTVDGTGSSARFSAVSSLVQDGSGNLIVVDGGAIRRVSAAGEVTTIAGSNVGGFDEVDGQGSAARFYLPYALAIGDSGNIYVVDEWGNTIRKLTPEGGVTTVAGTPFVTGYADGTGSAAKFSRPTGIAVDGSGNLLVADSGNQVVRKVTPAGVVTTVAGTAGVAGWADGAALSARFNEPGGIAIVASGATYIADSANHVIRRLSTNGNVSTFVGAHGSSGTADGTGTAARFNRPAGLAADAAGNLFVADYGNHTIRKITTAGAVSTVAGLAGVVGSADGAGSAARFNNPTNLAVDSDGFIYVSDTGNHLVRRISPAGDVVTLGGIPDSAVTSNGKGRGAGFNFPAGIAVGFEGVLYVAEAFGAVVRQGYLNLPAAPVITGHPAWRSVVLNSGATFSVSATGGPTPTIQWYKNGVAIPGATAGSYHIDHVVGSDIGAYYAVVQNSHGSVNSNVVALSIVPSGQDFDLDGGPDLLLQNVNTGQRTLWLMGGPNHRYVLQGLDLGYLDASWRIVATQDFNLNGSPDVLLENTVTGQRVMWLMGGPNNAYVMQGLDLGFLDANWHITGAADFNGDTAPDILLENPTTGQRVLWLMGGPNNAYVQLGLDLGYLDANWHMVGCADFNQDGAPDVLLENVVSGQRVLWLMGGPNNAFVIQGLDLGLLDPVWHIVKATDFDDNGAPDILLENRTSGQRVMWVMGGPNNAYVLQGLDMGVLDPAWQIVP